MNTMVIEPKEHPLPARAVISGQAADTQTVTDGRIAGEAVYTHIDLDRVNTLRLMEQYNIRGRSEQLVNTFISIKRWAATTATILIRGETGTGKDLMAKAIHDLSPRRNEPFKSINCAGIPDALFEAQLFGYERGAFTGATKMTKGFFEATSRGTLVLNEIHTLSMHLQAKLLQVLDDLRFFRVGGTEQIDVD